MIWDDDYKMINHEAMEKIIKDKEGRGGTEPVQIVKGLHEIKFKGHLIILTDGEVKNIDKADALMIKYNMNFEKVTVHIVNTSPNISVCAPFTRNCPHEIILHSGNV